jgi:putative peptidoglycan lipid II flippase
VAVGRAFAITLADVVVFVVAARLMRLTEVTSVIDTVTRRIPTTRGR